MKKYISHKPMKEKLYLMFVLLIKIKFLLFGKIFVCFQGLPYFLLKFNYELN